MHVSIKKWGNSVGVRIPSTILSTLNIQAESVVDIRVENNKIVIEPLKKNNYQLEQLLSAITPDNLHHEISTGQPVGQELL